MTERVVELSTGYRPRSQQAEIHRQLRRFNVLVCHRRFGKTVLCINELVDQAIHNTRLEPAPRYAYIAPFRNQAKDIAWDYLKHYTACFAGLPNYEVRESDLSITLPNKARIRIYGADNPDALRGNYLDGVVLDEYGQIPASLWGEVIRPQLADYRGWAIFIGTPKGKNAFYRRYRKAKQNVNWFTAIYRASETGVISADEIEEIQTGDLTEAEYEQEFECSWDAPLKGAYYGDDMSDALKEGRIRKVPHQRGLNVETWWDLGRSDATAIWFVQRAANEIHVIDYYENRLKEPDHYAMVLQTRAMANGYVYGEHILPHDGAHVRQGMRGLSLADMYRELNLNCRVQPLSDVMAGINRVRQILPRCWFDEEKCERGIEALKSYRSEEDENRSDGENAFFKDKPRHDWASHPADAFRTGAMYNPWIGEDDYQYEDFDQGRSEIGGY